MTVLHSQDEMEPDGEPICSAQSIVYLLTPRAFTWRLLSCEWVLLHAMALKVPFHSLSRTQSLKGIMDDQWDYCCWTNAGELQAGVCLCVQSSDQWLSYKPGARSSVAQDIDRSWKYHHPSQEITWGGKETIINIAATWTPDLLCILIAIAFTNSPSSPGSFVWGHGRG